GFAAGLEQQFAGKLPAFLVTPFAYALPFLEVTAGTLFVFGFFYKFCPGLAGLLFFAPTFGQNIESGPAPPAHNLSYAIIIFMLLWLAPHNRFSVDRLLRRRGVNQ